MEADRGRFGKQISLAVSLLFGTCFLPFFRPAQAQDVTPHEVGVVYYADGLEFKPLAKEIAPQSGHRNYSARVKGAHALLRLRAGQSQTFRVCGVDPSRYKLYTFKSAGDSRSVTLAKINIWIGGSKSTLSESEIAVTIQAEERDCFAIAPKEALKDGEYGFSPAGAEDVFMFGVGDVKQVK